MLYCKSTLVVSCTSLNTQISNLHFLNINKIRFPLFYYKQKKSAAIKPEGMGGGGKALMAQPLRK